MDNISTMIGRDFELQKNSIKKLVEARLKHLLDMDIIPDSLRYIVDEVSISRFNQIGSEGLSSHTVEGESQSWADDLFAPYMNDIYEYRRRHGGTAHIKFL